MVKIKDQSLQENPSLRASINDGLSHAVMMGSGETYFGPAGIFLQATTLQVGLLASFPQLFGAVMQWIGAIRMDRLRSRRRFILTGAFIQALSLIPMALIPVLFEKGPKAVFFLLAMILIYYGALGGNMPVWNSLIGDLLPAEIRGRFFGSRNRIAGMSSFISMFLAGLVLYLFQKAGVSEWGFTAIFLVACLARLNSVRWISKYGDPEFTISKDQIFTFRQFLKRSPQSNFAKFVFFIGAINFSVALSAPYFALYMLRDLNFSYIEFTLVMATATITQFLTFRYWGSLSDRFGNKKILNVCGWGVATVPLLWLISTFIPYLLIVQVFSGLVWSGFSLAAGNFLFDAVSPPKRARCVAYQGLINGILIFLGSTLGGYIAGHLPKSISLGPWSWEPLFMLPAIFFISSLMRFITAGIFLQRFKEVRLVEPIRHRDLIFRISYFRSIVDSAFNLFTGLFREKNGVENKK